MVHMLSMVSVPGVGVGHSGKRAVAGAHRGQQLAACRGQGQGAGHVVEGEGGVRAGHGS